MTSYPVNREGTPAVALASVVRGCTDSAHPHLFDTYHHEASILHVLPALQTSTIRTQCGEGRSSEGCVVPDPKETLRPGRLHNLSRRTTIISPGSSPSTARNVVHNIVRPQTICTAGSRSQAIRRARPLRAPEDSRRRALLGAVELRAERQSGTADAPRARRAVHAQRGARPGRVAPLRVAPRRGAAGRVRR